MGSTIHSKPFCKVAPSQWHGGIRLIESAYPCEQESILWVYVDAVVLCPALDRTQPAAGLHAQPWTRDPSPCTPVDPSLWACHSVHSDAAWVSLAALATAYGGAAAGGY